jgi:hypothetical protein
MRDLHRFLQESSDTTENVKVKTQDKEGRFASSKDRVLTKNTLYKLSPLMTFGDDEDKVVGLRHKAYRDYLVDPLRCPSSWFIDKGKAHRRMTISCFKIMQRALKFNICGLESSYLMNKDVKDRDARVKNSIPSYLSYACRFWGDHLHDVLHDNKTDSEIVRLLKDFLTIHLFHWLEVLNLLDEPRVAAASLRIAAIWLKVWVTVYTPRQLSPHMLTLQDIDGRLSSFAADGSRFAVTFAEVIAKSVPHIYLSALPFTPPSSPIYEHYCPRFPWALKVLHERDPTWPAMQFSISMEADVYSISVHPDGKRLTAGLDSNRVPVVDIATGEALFWLNNHGSRVRTVAYSPTGTSIATGELQDFPHLPTICPDRDRRMR